MKSSSKSIIPVAESATSVNRKAQRKAKNDRGLDNLSASENGAQVPVVKSPPTTAEIKLAIAACDRLVNATTAQARWSLAQQILCWYNALKASKPGTDQQTAAKLIGLSAPSLSRYLCVARKYLVAPSTDKENAELVNAMSGNSARVNGKVGKKSGGSPDALKASAVGFLAKVVEITGCDTDELMAEIGSMLVKRIEA